MTALIAADIAAAAANDGIYDDGIRFDGMNIDGGAGG